MRNHTAPELNDKGYSLVELIVSMLIMSVITGMVVMLISTSRNTYSAVNSEAVVQEEVETVRTFINEIAVEAEDCISNDKLCGEDDKYIWFLSPDNTGTSPEYYYYFILFESSTKKLRFGRYKSSEINLESEDAVINTLKTGSNKIKGEKYNLLAQYVNDITCTKTGNLITITLSMKYDDANVTKTLIFTGRNMSVNTGE